jgi:hypothetical protein
MTSNPYVIGATIFNVSGGSSWPTFEAFGIISRLLEYAGTLR